MAKYFSTKCYGHNIGLSAVFRQPHADSHCSLLHGYSLSFKFTFGCNELDERNWVVDFGGLKPLKKWLEDSFDHKVVCDRTVSYTHLRAHETKANLVCRLLLEKKQKKPYKVNSHNHLVH